VVAVVAAAIKETLKEAAVVLADYYKVPLH
jgi:hypothetical protein